MNARAHVTHKFIQTLHFNAHEHWNGTANTLITYLQLRAATRAQQRFSNANDGILHSTHGTAARFGQKLFCFIYLKMKMKMNGRLSKKVLI